MIQPQRVPNLMCRRACVIAAQPENALIGGRIIRQFAILTHDGQIKSVRVVAQFPRRRTVGRSMV